LCHDVEASLLPDDLRDRRISRGLRADVELDGVQIDLVVGCVLPDIGGLRRVAARGAAHRRVDDVARFGERVGGEPAEAAGSTGDDDNLVHDAYLFQE
jgi:hypothetical protein